MYIDVSLIYLKRGLNFENKRCHCHVVIVIVIVIVTTHGNAPKGSGFCLRPKTHIHNISVQAHKPLQILKALTATEWGKQKETLMATYKVVMRQALEYASSVWLPIASSTSINKLQGIHNAAMRITTGCTQDTNIQHLHDETLTPPYTSTYSSTPHNKNRKYNIHHILYTSTQHTSTLQS